MVLSDELLEQLCRRPDRIWHRRENYIIPVEYIQRRMRNMPDTDFIEVIAPLSGRILLLYEFEDDNRRCPHATSIRHALYDYIYRLWGSRLLAALQSRYDTLRREGYYHRWRMCNLRLPNFLHSSRLGIVTADGYEPTCKCSQRCRHSGLRHSNGYKPTQDGY